MSEVLEVKERDLFRVYSLLADATEAAAAGDPNTCASKAAEAKELVVELKQEAKEGGPNSPNSTG